MSVSNQRELPSIGPVSFSGEAGKDIQFELSELPQEINVGAQEASSISET